MLNQITSKIEYWLTTLNEAHFTTHLLRAIYITILEINNGYITLHAKSLVYTTLMTMVPVLAISFATLQFFNVHNLIGPFLQNLLQPLGEKGQEITNYIINFIDNVNVGLIGITGTLVLLYTVISTIAQLEETLNYIWKVKAKRHLIKRIFFYLPVVMIAPAFIFIAFLLTASLANMSFVKWLINIEPFGTFYYSIVQFMPYAMTIFALSLIYKFLTNTFVRLDSALIGGTIATIAWKSIAYGFTIFLKNSSNYDAIYSGFAALIIFLLWLYISWLIFILGGLLAYAYQQSRTHSFSTIKSTIAINDEP